MLEGVIEDAERGKPLLDQAIQIAVVFGRGQLTGGRGVGAHRQGDD